MKTLEYEVQKSDEGRVDALVARLLGMPRARSRGLVDHEGVAINGQVCSLAATPVRCADRLTLRFDPERKYQEKPVARATRDFAVVYADEHLVVVVKDAGLLTVPTERGEQNTLIDRLSRHLAAGRDHRRGVSVVHRLDRETSGLLVFGRTPLIAKRLSDQFAARKPQREYYALVAGRVATESGELRSYLATDKALNQRSLPQGTAGGELAVTHYKVLAHFPGATLVAVTLETGRRNQIRAHFAELGHPVLGDQRYRREQARHPRWPYPRLALHARLLGFQHPVDGRAMRFVAELPREFRAFGVK